MADLRRKVKGLNIGAQKKHQDFDPEDELLSKQAASDEDSESDSNQSADEQLGREHYQAVGKSKLRKPEKTRLDEKKYSGQAVSRDKIFQHDDDVDALAPELDEDEDPFGASTASKTQNGEASDDDDEVVDRENLEGDIGSDEEIDSDEAFEKGEEDKLRGKGFVFRGSGKDLRHLPVGSDDESDGASVDEEDSVDVSGESSEEQSDADMDDIDGMETDGDEEDAESALENEDEDNDDDESEDDEELDIRPRPSAIRPTGTTDLEKIQAIMSGDTAALASSLHAIQSEDARKGVAVKKQYQTFDRLLDARIKLQKGLTASNELQIDHVTTDEEAQTAFKKAEEAALKLYATIESLRHSILEANTSNTVTKSKDQPSKKRKRPSHPTPATSTTDLWIRLETLETQTQPTRLTTLDKWSLKTRPAAPLASTSTSKFSSSSTSSQSDPKITTILTTYLNTELPKLQTISQPTPTTYVDTNFYQSLLRDLINSRATTNTNSNSHPPIVPTKLHNTNKLKSIDTKASKGRKVRYSVHEKLANFMAGEGRGNSVGQWNDGAAREFFGSLLGQRGVLGEEGVDDYGDVRMSNGENEEGGREVEALRLFRT